MEDSFFTFILRNVLHESCYNQCSNSDDTCATWAPARELEAVMTRHSWPLDEFDAWHLRWYNPPLPTKPSLREIVQRTVHKWWHGGA